MWRRFDPSECINQALAVDDELSKLGVPHYDEHGAEYRLLERFRWYVKRRKSLFYETQEVLEQTGEQLAEMRLRRGLCPRCIVSESWCRDCHFVRAVAQRNDIVATLAQTLNSLSTALVPKGGDMSENTTPNTDHLLTRCEEAMRKYREAVRIYTGERAPTIDLMRAYSAACADLEGLLRELHERGIGPA